MAPPSSLTRKVLMLHTLVCCMSMPKCHMYCIHLPGRGSSMCSGICIRYLAEAIRVGHVLLDEQPAPAAFHVVKVFPMKRNARAHDLHILFVALRSSLTWAEWAPERLFEMA